MAHVKKATIARDAPTEFSRCNTDSLPVNDEIVQRLMAIRIEDSLKLSSLTNDDLEKIVFLLFPYLKMRDFANISLNEPPEIKIRYLVNEVSRTLKSNNSNLSPGMIACELLYLIKRFRLLKEQPFGMCKHIAAEKFEDSSKNIVPKFWRKLFEICENLSDEETAYLCTLWGGEQVRAERIFFHLWEQRRISENNLSILSNAFKTMGRNDLISLVEGLYSYSLEPLVPGQKIGLAVIINQRTFNKPTPFGCVEHKKHLDDRVGTDFDEGGLTALWQSFGLDVLSYQDLTSQDVNFVLDSLLSREYNGKIFVCCILSHGDSGFFLGSDRVKVDLESIFSRFGMSKFFEDIPKLFFVQACQGTCEQTGVGGKVTAVRNMRHDAATDSGNAPCFSDMLIGMSTIPGFVSYRSTEMGSVYIQHLVEALSELGETMDLVDVMRVVTRRVADEVIEQEYKQMTNLVTRLRYRLYFKKIH